MYAYTYIHTYIHTYMYIHIYIYMQTHDSQQRSARPLHQAFPLPAAEARLLRVTLAEFAGKADILF